MFFGLLLFNKMLYNYVEVIYLEVGEKIKALRTMRGWTQKELAFRAGLIDSTVRKYESGAVTPKMENLKKITDALEVSLSPFMDFDPEGLEWTAKLDDNEIKLISKFNLLNDKGRQKAIEQVEDLAKIPDYQKDKTSGEDK